MRKIINLTYLRFSYLLSVKYRLKTGNLSPFFLSVEITDYCNLHCPECPVGVRHITKAERHCFEFSLYKKIIDSQRPTLQHVILYFQGEPFLNPQLAEFISYAHRAGVYTSTSTNGQMLSKKNARDIVSSGLDRLIVSIDGADQETYASYRAGGSLQKALDGIREIVCCKRELNSATPKVEVQFLVLKSNEHQLKAMKQLARSLGVDKLTFKSAQLYDFEQGNPLLTTIDKYARYKKLPDGRYTIKNPQRNRCWRLWSGAVVNARGEVLPCCFDKNSAFSFGNVYENTFDECWHSKKASGFRERILQNRKQFEMCRNCTG